MHLKILILLTHILLIHSEGVSEYDTMVDITDRWQSCFGNVTFY